MKIILNILGVLFVLVGGVDPARHPCPTRKLYDRPDPVGDLWRAGCRPGGGAAAGGEPAYTLKVKQAGEV